MKTKLSFFILFIVLLSTPLLSALELTDDEKNGIIFMREEEKLARDVYKALYDKWKINAFANIQKSEATHMSEVKTLIDMYSLKDPVDKDIAGKFSNDKLQKLYDELLAKGLKSEADAITVGFTIEEVDIRDLEELQQKTLSAEIKSVYSSLIQGSKNHMRAFYTQSKKYGVKYKPIYISEKYFNEIIAGK